jgi:hypothetical protein
MKDIRSIIKRMIPYYYMYNQAIINIASYFNKNSIPPKELPAHNYEWDIQKEKDNA